MKKIRVCKNKITGLLFLLNLVVLTPSFSQVSGAQNSCATRFKKQIEYNLSGSGLHNLDSKKEVELLLFSEHNSTVEYFINPSFGGAYGFSIDKSNTDNCFRLAIKRIVNWKEVQDTLRKEYPIKSVNFKNVFTPEDNEKKMKELRESGDFNRRQFDLSQRAALSKYLVHSDTLLISHDLAKRVHDVFTTLIDKFVGVGEPVVVKGGFDATFRCVVKDEVWTFSIATPSGKFGELVKICNQMVDDTKTNGFSESTYLKMLNAILK